MAARVSILFKSVFNKFRTDSSRIIKKEDFCKLRVRLLPSNFR